MAKRPSAVTLGVGVAAAAGLGVLAYRTLAPRRQQADEAITYPPLDTLKPVADAVWIVDSGPLRASGLKIPVRMTVLRLSNGDMLLHSPTRFTPELAREIEALGPLRHLVAPNSVHWSFLADWQRAFPEAISWGAPGLRDRAQVRRAGVKVDRQLGQEAPAEWSPDLTQGIVPGGAGFREVYLFHRSSCTLVLTDLIQNLEPAKLPPATALMMKAAGATRGKTAFHVRAILMAAGQPAMSAIRAMIGLEPERVIFSHGRWFAKDGARQLRRAFAWLPARSS